jgi:Cytochrome C'
MTKRRVVILATLLVLALSAWAAWSALHRGEAADIQALADRVAKKNDRALKEEGEALAKKYKSLGQFMNLFKERTPKGGGLGVGKESGAIQPDGIEAKIKVLARRTPSTSELEEQSDALIRMTQVTIAVAEVAKHKCEVAKKVGYMDPADWNRWSEDMQQSSWELAEAVTARDGAKVQAAAARLYSNCNNCHRIFRE